MKKIEDIINEYFKKIAERILALSYTPIDKEEKKQFMDITLSIGEGGKSENELFYEMLDTVTDKILDTNLPALDNAPINTRDITCSEYYKELTVIYLKSLRLERYVKKEKSEAVEMLALKLKKTVTIKRISELIYYKLCHKRYERRLEIAFRCVVEKAAAGSEDIDGLLNSDTASIILNMTYSIVKEQIDNFYNRVYNNGLPESYRVIKDEYYSSDYPFCYFSEWVRDESGIIDNVQRYREIIDSYCREDNFYTLDECLSEYKGEYSMSRNTYRDCFKKVLTVLAGYCYDDEFIDKYHASDSFILKTLCPEINALIDYFAKRFNGAKDCYRYISQSETKSRFIYIDSERDFIEVGRLIKTYKQLLTVLKASYNEEYTADDIYLPSEAEFIENRS